ncbi:MAG TPA: hypothetical protein VFS50_17975 [Meiothermus sp.]|nr:hypothetical protein [Meiothermus sp.]
MKTPLYYTFGNHMHWADMEWLRGYHVLPGSARDMLRFCRESGARGQVNFDAIGYEKMAAEAPDALAELREAIRRGTIEVSGASYGQPYGLFQGGESNVRQRVYGVRGVLRTLGVRPRTFWEEFDFFPQLPQMLRGWGWSTPRSSSSGPGTPPTSPRKSSRRCGGWGWTALGSSPPPVGRLTCTNGDGLRFIPACVGSIS